MPRKVASLAELPGVGGVLRDRIVTVLSPDGSEGAALRLINDDPYVLLAVPGIGAQRIVRILREGFGVSPPEVMRRMAEHHKALPAATLPAAARAEPPVAGSGAQLPRWHLEDLPGVTARLADRAREVLGAARGPGQPPLTPAELRAYVEADPYRLMRVPGFGFARVDRIAREFFGLHPDDARRHRHVNGYVLQQSAGVLSLGEFRRRRAAFGVSDASHELEGVTFDEGLVWDEAELDAELRLMEWASDALAAAAPLPRVPERVEAEMLAYGLNDEQRAACWAGLNLPAMAMTGGAGTGKTTTVAALAGIASRRGLNVHVMAFAGKGSDRLAEALVEFGLEPVTQGPYGDTVEDPNRSLTYYGRVFVSTIHRGLAATGSGEFMLRQLAADVVVLDEASMLPNALLAAVIERLRPEARLLLVGDPRQLPPIQYGQPFEALLNVGLPHFELVRNYRQADQEGIFTLAQAIRERRAAPLTGRPGVTALMGRGFEENLLAAVEEILASGVGFDLMRWQVVCALNVTRERLNELLQARLNPRGEPLARYREFRSGRVVTVREGDKVVVQRNDYTLGVFNGQTGLVVGFDDDEGALVVRIGASEVLIDRDLVPELLRLGYAITTHKAQGSGWHTVVVAEPGAVTLHPNRWTYTSVTRASHHLYLVSELTEAAWWAMAFREPPPAPTSLERRIVAARRSATNVG